MQSKTQIDGQIQVVSSHLVVSAAEQITCDAQATDDIDNSKCSVDIENDTLTMVKSEYSKNMIKTDTHTDLTFSSKGINISNLNVKHIVPKIDEIRILMSNENSPPFLAYVKLSYVQITLKARYNFFCKERTDTQEKHGGGLFFYFKLT